MPLAVTDTASQYRKATRMSRSLPSAPGPSAVDASLNLLAHQVLDQVRADELEPCLLFVEPAVDDVRLGIKPLDGAHPSTLLLGFVAPDEWYALGVAAGGWAYDVADRATGAPARHRVVVVTIVSRSGEVAHRTHVVDDPAADRRLRDAGDEVDGEQVDLLRLSLGLDTPDAPCDTGVYWAIEWLSAVLATEHTADWDRVADLHPARRILDRSDKKPHAGMGLATTATIFARACRWPRLRRMVEQGTYETVHLSRTDARWLDDGAFARYLLNRCPPLADLRRRVRAELPFETAAHIDLVLDEIGIPETSWPDRRAA